LKSATTQAAPAAPQQQATPAPGSRLLQRKCACGRGAGMRGTCEGCGREHLTLRRSPSAPAASATAPAVVHEALSSPGRPLDAPVRREMETRLGHDFSRVRVHTGALAAESAESVAALAYTVGSSIVFGRGQYAPETTAGKRLLAHELTHTVQQAESVGALSPSLKVGEPTEWAEREADRAAEAAVATHDHEGARDERPHVTHAGPYVARQPKKLATVEEQILRELTKKVGPENPEGEKAWLDGLRTLFQGVPAAKARALYERLRPEDSKDSFAVYFRRQLPPEARLELLGILREKFSAEAAKPAAEPPKAADPAVEGEFAKRTVTEIMRDEKYLDNNFKMIQFFSAELAIIHYADGGKYRLGLVPEHIQDPVAGVDYHSQDHIPVQTAERGKMGYVPRGQSLPDWDEPGKTAGDVLAQRTRAVYFRRDAASGRILPTQVNNVTAPKLCQMLREAEAEYVKDIEAFAEGGKKVFEKLRIVLEIAGLLPAGPAAAGRSAAKAAEKAAESEVPAAAAALATRAVLNRGAAIWTKAITELLSKGGGEINQLVVEGVSFGSVEVTQHGPKVFLRYFFIENVGRVPERGRLMQEALELGMQSAVKNVAAEQGQVMVSMVQNPKLAVFLESRGYIHDSFMVGKKTWIGLVKTIKP